MIKLPILLTASISTRGMVGADFSDTEREKMYLETLIQYIEEFSTNDSSRHIIFVENSGWDIEEFQGKIPFPLSGKSVEFISLDPKDFDVTRGKGYNELIMLNQVIERSAVVKEIGAFMKVTGRYPIYNLAYYLESADKFIGNGGQFWGDIKDHKVYDFLFPHNTAKWNGHAAYTVLFATTVDFYKKRLGPLYSECNDYIGRWVECVWYDALKGFRGKKGCGVSLRFRREPICGGLQGSGAQTIAFSKSNQSLKSRIMRFVGNCIRIFMPWFWF